jgi:hypothetical protein
METKLHSAANNLQRLKTIDKGLIAVISVGLLFIANSAFADLPVFESGVVIESNGEVLPIDQSGFTAPCLGDWDGDGDWDLLVGVYQDGPVQYFENTGDESNPVLNDRGLLEADGDDIAAPYA